MSHPGDCLFPLSSRRVTISNSSRLSLTAIRHNQCTKCVCTLTSWSTYASILTLIDSATEILYMSIMHLTIRSDVPSVQTQIICLDESSTRTSTSDILFRLIAFYIPSNPSNWRVQGPISDCRLVHECCMSVSIRTDSHYHRKGVKRRKS